MIKLKYDSQEEVENALQSLSNNISLLVSSDDELLARFAENLAAFSDYYPEIHEFYKDYEPKRYVLDVVDGFPSPVNLETGKHLYDYPAYLLSQLQYLDFCKKAPIKKFHFNVKEENEAAFLHVDFLDEFSHLFDEIEEKDGKPCKQLKKNVSSLISFGVGVGYHIESLALNHQINCFYIVEPDLDLFFMSLFSVNWRLIFETLNSRGSSIHISLGEQQETFFDEFLQFAGNNGRYQMSHVGGYIHYLSKEINDILTQFNDRYLEMGRGYGFFDDAVMSIGHTLANVEQNIPIVKYESMKSTELASVPVFIVGNGPSLDKSIETIRQLQNQALIISCGSAISALYKYGITPDFHCEQERTEPVKDKLLLSCPREYLAKLPLLAPTTVHPSVFELFDRSIMAPKGDEPSSAMLLRDKVASKVLCAYRFINPTVANTAICMASALGFKEFYFFGVDLGHKDGNAHHSKQSLYYGEEENDIGLYDIKRDDLLPIEGNFGEQFVCDRFFKESNESITRLINSNPSLLCFNLSDGAKINGTKPMTNDGILHAFTMKRALNKKEKINYLFKNNVFLDESGAFLERLLKDLDKDGFAATCHSLINSLDKPVESISDASHLLLTQTKILRDTNDHIHDLLIGTLLHMQVMLNHIIYDAVTEKSALKNFEKGLAIYRRFLSHAVSYYQENAEVPHYVEKSSWISKLKEHVSE